MRERVAKIAGGQSVEEAAAAWARRSRGEHLPDRERALVEELDATIEAMFLMAAVDGSVTRDETAQLAASLQAFLDQRGRGGTLDVDAMLVDLSRRLERDGWTTRLDSVASRLTNHESRSFAFRLAVAVAFVDDRVAHAEAAAIDALAAALHLSTDQADVILHEVRETLFPG